MPTIDQIAIGQALSPSDEFLVSQIVGGVRVTAKATLGNLTALLASLGLQPVSFISGTGLPASTLGSDGWTYLNVSTGDVYQHASGLWSKIGTIAGPAGSTGPAGPTYSLGGLPTTTSMDSTDLVAINQTSTDKTITLSNLLGGETIDLLSGAGAASDTDTFMVGQGSNILVRQTIAAMWTYLQGKLPGYKVPVQEITANKVIDATYNGQILVVTGAGVTITPNFTLMGAGFECEIVTSGSGTVIWSAGVTATNGGTGLSVGQYAKLIAFSSSAGNVVLACVGAASVVGVAAPGPISGLALGSATPTSLAFTWAAPVTGGTATFYQVQYRVYGSGSAWTSVSPNPTVPSVTVTGLFSSQQYDVQVAGVTSTGTVGSYVQLLNVITSAPASFAPNVPSSVATGTVTSASIALNWAAPSVDGSHSAASSYLVAYSSNGGPSFSSPVNVGNVTSYTFSGLSASTAYVLEVAASNGAGSSSYVTASASTSAGGTQVPNAVTSLSVGTVTGFTVPLTWMAPAVDGSHSAATAYTVQYRLNGSSVWQTASSGVSGTSYTVAGLISGQTYQFNVFATNAGGAGAGSMITGTPTASGLAFNCWGTGGYPTSPKVHSSGGNAVVAFLVSGTNVASCQYGWSTTQTAIPQSLSAGTVYSSTVYGTLNATAPATPGTYYVWILFYDSSGNCLLAVVGTTGQVDGGGNAITAAVTVT